MIDHLGWGWTATRRSFADPAARPGVLSNPNPEAYTKRVPQVSRLAALLHLNSLQKS